MSKLYFTIFLCLIFKINTSAQVSLTLKDYPPIGTQIIGAQIIDTANLNNFKFAITGTNNFWDFSKLSLNHNDTVNFIDPKNTPYQTNFFEADRAAKYGSNNDYFSYYKADSNGYYLLGDISFMMPCPFSQPLKYNKPRLYLQFPSKYPYLKYDTTKLRTVNNLNNSGDTAYCERHIFSSIEIVATGTIKLPFGLFESFLLKESYNCFDTTWIKNKDGKWSFEINALPSGSDSYYWFCNKSTIPVAGVAIPGLVNIRSISVQMNNYANIKSLTVEDVSSLKTNIYPNPATEKLFIENNFEQNRDYIITNLLGQEINKGVLKSEIDISHFLNGVYVLKIVSTNNQNEIFKFVKQ
jgi:hypothetical protein